MWVDDTVKVSPKKHAHQTRRNLGLNFLFTPGTIKYRALLYVASLTLYAWCMYWIARDIFIWHKPLAELNILCYAGSIASIAFIWLGSRMWRSHPKEVQKEIRKDPQKEVRKAPLPSKQPLKQPAPPIQPPTSAPALAESSCAHYLGYLHQREKSAEIPAECLTCTQVIQCFSAEIKNAS
jgi:hypothetical protein